MQIGYLADHAAFVPTLARWHHAQWSYLSPGDSVERRIAGLRKQSGRRQIPTTFVAYDTTKAGDKVLIGSASLIAQDMDTRPELSPWLASVYVAAEHRRQGIGSSLVRRGRGSGRAGRREALPLYPGPGAVLRRSRLDHGRALYLSRISTGRNDPAPVACGTDALCPGRDTRSERPVFGTGSPATGTAPIPVK